MAYQLPGGGGGGGGVAPDLNPLLQGGGAQEPPPAAEVDRISSLPENVRLHIMGSLPLKPAVMLGMVSKSWRDLVKRRIQPHGGGGVALALVLNALPPEGGEQAPDPLAAEVFGVSSQPSMGTESGGGGGARATRRRRVSEQGGQRTEVAAGASDTCISALPVDVRRHILTGLPLKDAVRSGSYAQEWRNVWKTRWSEQTSCLDIHIRPNDKPMEVLHELESGCGPRPRLDRFSLLVDNQRFRNKHLKRFLKYAAECRVEDLQIDLRGCKPDEKFIYHLPQSSPLLAHLYLRNINISDHYCKDDTPPFDALEVIRLHSVDNNVNSSKVLGLCPRLRILELRRCPWVVLSPYCQSLRSFRYYSDKHPHCIPSSAALADLYMCFGGPIPSRSWDDTLPNDLSSLTILTVCSNALKVVSTLLSDDGPSCRWDKMSKLPSLKELQLLMHGKETHNLDDIYLLLKSCHFSNLERLFVQLPASSDVPLMDLGEEVSVELPGEDSLVKLGMVKIMNFNWQRFEVQLVSVLLRKATSQCRFLLVSTNVDPSHVPGVQDADHLKEALSGGGRIIVSESDDEEIQPFHHEVFIEE